MNKVKKILLLGVVLIMGMGLFAGCSGKMKITDFEGLENLPRNPSRAVFITDFSIGEDTEFEVPQEKIEEIMNVLFARNYVKQKSSGGDILNDYLRIYDADGNHWKFHIRYMWKNGDRYIPSNDDSLTRNFLLELVNK